MGASRSTQGSSRDLTTRWVTRFVVGSITTSASSPNLPSEQSTLLPSSSLICPSACTARLRGKGRRQRRDDVNPLELARVEQARSEGAQLVTMSLQKRERVSV